MASLFEELHSEVKAATDRALAAVVLQEVADLQSKVDQGVMSPQEMAAIIAGIAAIDPTKPAVTAEVPTSPPPV